MATDVGARFHAAFVGETITEIANTAVAPSSSQARFSTTVMS